MSGHMMERGLRLKDHDVQHYSEMCFFLSWKGQQERKYFDKNKKSKSEPLRNSLKIDEKMKDALKMASNDTKSSGVALKKVTSVYDSTSDLAKRYLESIKK